MSSPEEPAGQIGAEHEPGGFGERIGGNDGVGARSPSRRPSRRLAAPPARRWLALLLIPGLLVGAGWVDRSGDGDGDPDRLVGGAATGPVDLAEPAGYLPVAPPAGALSSTWYCAGGTATPDGRADHEVFLANFGDGQTTATVTVYPSEGQDDTVTVEVPPRFRSSVRLQDVVEAPFAAAVVETSGGDVAVEHRVSGPLGTDTAPCATAAADRWIATGGSTLIGHDEVLAILNPFPADAVVDVTVISEGGDPPTSAPTTVPGSTTTTAPEYLTSRPGPLQGLPVPAGSLYVAQIRELVPRRAQIVATVEARTGRVVVDQLQSYNGALIAPPPGEPDPTGLDPSLGEDVVVPPGLTVGLAAPQPATRWVFPDGRKEPGAHERFVVYNPSEEAADVDVSVTPAGAGPSPDVAPFEITGLAPGSFQVIDLDDEDRVPDGPHSAVVRSVNGVPVVARRLLYGTAPWDHSGAEATNGSPVSATRWVLAAGTSVAATDEQIVVRNPSAVAATVRVTLLDGGREVTGSRPGPVEIEVDPGTREVVALRDLGLPNTDLATVVTSDQPVVVERALQDNTGVGLSTSIAIPAPTGAQVLR